MPLDAYLQTPQQKATLHYATFVVAATCMDERGIDVQIPSFESLADWYAVEDRVSRTNSFGRVDRASARAYGFGGFIEGGPDVEVKVGDELGASEAWGGSDDDDESADRGCRTKARMLVEGASYKDLIEYSEGLAHALQVQASDRAYARADTDAVYRDLGLCLRDAGYDVPNPIRPYMSGEIEELSSGALERGEGDEVPADEVKLALADIECKVKINQRRRLEKIQAEEEQRLLEANALALEEEQKKLQKSLKRAADVMAGKDIG